MTKTAILEVKNKNGLHTRPAGLLCNITNNKKYSLLGIFMTYNGVKVDAKSILNVLTLGAISGAKVVLEVEGEDEEAIDQLIAHMTTFFDSAFEETAEAKMIAEEDA